MPLTFRRDHILAWAEQWVTGKEAGHTIIAVPRLFLSQQATMELASMTPYQKVFDDAVVELEGEHHIQVLHAGFSLYRTGEAEIRQFACVIKQAGPSDIGKLVAAAAQLLRSCT